MLGKVLGLVVAGVFIGAAVVEFSGLLSRRRSGKEVFPPQATDKDTEDADTEDAKEHSQTAFQAEG